MQTKRAHKKEVIAPDRINRNTRSSRSEQKYLSSQSIPSPSIQVLYAARNDEDKQRKEV